MADEAPDHSPEPTPGERRDPGPSDLVGVRLTLYLGIAIVATLASFFFVGVVVGIIVLLACIVLGTLGFVTAIRRADQSD